jgi:TRAP-type C4-dicarboxylate transport system permease small subunit
MDGRTPATRLVRLLEAVAAAVLLVVMLVVLVDVAGRNLLNRPLPWGTELVEILLAVLIFSLYPVLGWRGNNITVDLITVRPTLQQVQRALSSLLGAGLFGVIAWCMARQGIRAADFDEATPLLQVPTAWVMWGLAIMAGATVLAFLVHLRSVFAAPGVRAATQEPSGAVPAPILE